METQLDTASTALIEEHIRRLTDVMGFEEVEVRAEAQDSVLRITINAGDEGRSLIGSHGSHLLSLQHIVRCLLRNQIDASVRISVDVNGYRARREKSLMGLAEETARKANRTGRTVVLQPMSAADRRMIHTALAGNKSIKTESQGDEPNRRVVVRPIFL